MPKVSVVICSYNRRHILPHMIHNLLRNTHSFELILVDNHSTDGTREYLASIEDKLSKLVLNEENLGNAVAHNMGIRAGHGDYFILFDDDEVPAPNYIEELLQGALDVESAGLKLGHLGSGYCHAIPHRVFKEPMDYEKWMNHPEIDHLSWEQIIHRKTEKTRLITKKIPCGNTELLISHFITGTGSIYPRSTFEKIGLYRKVYGFGTHHVDGSPVDKEYCMRGWGDVEFNHRCRCYGYVIGTTLRTSFAHVRECFTNRDRDRRNVHFVSTRIKERVEALERFGAEDLEASKRGVIPPTVPRL